jgi:hypothetical protein
MSTDIDPHDICDTDPANGLCAVNTAMAEAGWKHAVEQKHAGEMDHEDLFPLLISVLGGIQHHLGYRLDDMAEELERQRDDVEKARQVMDSDAYRLATGETCRPGQPAGCGDYHNAGQCVRQHEEART